jgi:Cu-Zn family superoxide dismutase
MSLAKHLIVCAPLAMLAACSQSAKTTDADTLATAITVTTNAHAVVNDSAGKQLATATFTQDSAGAVHVQMHAQGLTPGDHGVHFHAVGTCTAAAFASAGGHFNPDTTKHHGLNNPAGPHAGDLPNMVVDSAGNADYTAVTSDVSLTPGAKSLFDTDGSALIIHATADDNMTDPAGNAGGRIGCGLVESGAASA